MPLSHTVVLGLIAAWGYERSGSIGLAKVLHDSWNTETSLALATRSYDA